LKTGENEVRFVFAKDLGGGRSGFEIVPMAVVVSYVTQVSEKDNPGTAPAIFFLEQNYPNPFNPVTEIRFGMPTQSMVKLEIFNVLGQVMKTLVDEVKEAGYYRVSWDGTNQEGLSMPSGVYFYRLTAGKFVRQKKLVMIR